ncbi:MAG TPA: DUF4139 domain-containing protein [Stellaceae bacterium]|nr:DUF4139 domain-containing protein [Stellaceae bacterium]
MRRLAAGLALSLLPGFAFAAPDLALKRVMLSSGGVGYFEYEAEIDGPATLGLDVPLDEVDDVLKSLTVFDNEGGVGGIELPGRDGSRAAFGDIPLDPSALNSPLAYLNGLQGIEVEVAGPRSMTGRIMQAETVMTEVPGRDGAPPAQVPRTRVTLLTSDGLRQFVLEESESVQVTDPKLRDGIGKALEELRRASSHDKRHLTLRIAGKNRRTVRVGYVVAAPLWKTTYRLVLPEAGKDKAVLQGWAVLENESGVDWNGVELTLQSGNPVTFRQALYRTYFVQRPEVPVEVFNRILPPEDIRARPMEMNAAKAMPPPPPAPEGALEETTVTAGKRAAGMQSVPMVMDSIAASAEPTQETEAEASVVFRLAKPVMLAAGHTASVPLLDRQVKAESVDLARDGGEHPLAAVKLTNDTGSGLPPGVLALFSPGEDAFFAGDARVGSLPAGETRLLSFAEDLRSTVDWKQPATRTLTTLAAADGVLRVKEKSRTTRVIAVTAPVAAAQRVLVEIPRSDNDEIEIEGGKPAGMEETKDAWRLPYDLKAGETRTVTVHVDSTSFDTIALNADAAGRVLAYADAEGLAPEAKSALQRLAQFQRAAAAQDEEKKRLEAVANSIAADEARIRENLKAVAPGDSLHTRLVKQLETDEDSMAAARHDIDQATAAADKARRDLAEAVTGLRL